GSSSRNHVYQRHSLEAHRSLALLAKKRSELDSRVPDVTAHDLISYRATLRWAISNASPLPPENDRTFRSLFDLGRAVNATPRVLSNTRVCGKSSVSQPS